MLITSAHAWIRRFSPFYNRMSAGGDGGGGGQSGSMGSGGQGQGSGQGGGQGGGQSAAEIAIADENALVRIPGSQKAVPWKEFIGGYVPRADQDAWEARRQQAEAALLERAKLLDTLHEGITKRGKGGNDGGDVRSGQGNADILAALRDNPVVSGQEIVALYERMQNEGIKPLIDAITQRDGVLKKLAEGFKGLQGHLNPVITERSEQQLNAGIDKALAGLGFKDIAPDSILRTIATDVWMSHDPADPNLAKEFGNMLKSRFDEMRKFFRELDRKEVEDGKRRSRFPHRGGQATGQGSGPARVESPREMARRFFGTVENRT